MPNENTTARLATIGQLEKNILPNFLDPVPGRDTLRALFDGAGIPRFKANPTAKRGGGFCYYSLAAVEKLFRSRTLPGGAMLRARGPVMG